jgi:outer membrane murein-binding lipoprotein Lpp
MGRREKMTTINTMQDLTRLLRENPEWRDEIRRELLTEELLELPQRFAEYTKVTDRRLDGIDRKIDALTNNVNRLTGRVDALTNNVNTLTIRVDALTDNVNRLTGRVDTLGYRVDSLRGYALEAKLPTKLPPLVSREFDARRIYLVWRPALLYGTVGWRNSRVGWNKPLTMA